MPAQSSSLAAFRMIDANRNRASEGLRVAEDYCRFALGDQHLTRLIKHLRHDLVAALATLDSCDLLAARDTEADVGTAVSTAAEQSRQSLEEIALAAWPRTQQALRVIEECLKLVAPQTATQVEALRYRSYTLAKACQLTAGSQRRLADARLYVLIDAASSECALVERVQSLIAARVDVIQLREKRLADRELLARARLLRRVIDEAGRKGEMSNVESQLSKEGRRTNDKGQMTKDHSPLTTRHSLEPAASRHPLFIMNDRPDLAVLAGADGVHVGQDELSVQDVRRIVGTQMLVGISTHNIEQARQAVLDGASYIGCGPTFPSTTKQFAEFPGLDFLRQVAAEISLPAFAIGGITPGNVAEAVKTGIRRIAVSSAVARADDLETAVASLLAEMD